MPFNDGDFVLVEYTLYLPDEESGKGKVIETTSEKIAKENKIYSENERYGPYLVIIGEGKILPGLEEAIREMEEGEEKEVEIPPEKAYGQYDPGKIKPMYISQLVRAGVRNIRKGDILRINGKYAVVKDIRGRRVYLDFNHPLAGKTIKAKIKIVKKLVDNTEKIKYLLLRRSPPAITEEDVDVNRENNKIVVKLSEKVFEIPNFQLIKTIVVKEAEKYLDLRDVEAITFIETYPVLVSGGEEQEAQEPEREEKEEKEEVAASASEKEAT